MTRKTEEKKGPGTSVYCRGECKRCLIAVDIMTFNRAWIVCPHWGSWGGAVVGMMHAHLAEIHMLNNDPVKLLKFSN